MFTLLQFLIIMAIVALAFSFSSQGEDAVMTVLVSGVGIWILATFIPSLAVQVRRFHDQDLTGWLVLLGFIPYVGGLIVLVFMCIDGTRGPNKYGPDPKGGVDPSVLPDGAVRLELIEATGLRDSSQAGAMSALIRLAALTAAILFSPREKGKTSKAKV
jgi:uncharacterized membrane protein YhaH (DUF805 family)